MPGVGLEPTREEHSHKILSLARLPVPPPGQLMGGVGLEPTTFSV